MGDMMTFPETVDEFMEEWKITDTEEVYTNGTELVPIFRMKQWFEHVRSNDTIDRQAAVNVVRQICERCGKYKEYNGVMCGACALDGVDDSIEDLPSAEPVKNELTADFVDTAEKAAKVEIMSEKDAQVTLDNWKTYNRISEADHETD